jgi:hypothetical protein
MDEQERRDAFAQRSGVGLPSFTHLPRALILGS